jgi:ubiquinone/menaquinone biosynthesis C-methylase UbiE
VLVPLTPERSDLLAKLREPRRLDHLVASGVSLELVRRAVVEELVLVFHKPEHPAPRITTFMEAAHERLPEIPASLTVDAVGEWNDRAQVDAYEAFSARSRLYQDTSRELVERAGVGGAQRVADLASGTGNTTRAVLSRLAAQGRVIGVDPAERMVTRARAQVTDPRATFLQGTAETLVREALADGPFARVVCNSALWLAPDIKQELGRIRGAMEPGSVFAFSIPAPLLGRGEHLSKSATEQFVRALEEARALLAHELKPRAAALDPAIGTVEGMREALERSAFADVEFQLWNRPWPASEYLDWLDLPVIRNDMVPPDRRSESARLIELIRERLDPDLELNNPFYFVIARAIG